MHSAIAGNGRRIDISKFLTDPAFWALQMSLTESWGSTRRELDEAYLRFLQRYWDDGIWPFIRLGIDEARYLEIEYADIEDMEKQNRLWIGGKDGGRVLLGYDSGHFSFPWLRIAEVLTIANQLSIHRAAPLLLLRGAYLSKDDKPPTDAVRTWLQQAPGVKPDSTPDIVEELLDNVVADVQWRKDPALGWINNGIHSQRNPKGPMSVLKEPDFRFIQWFFDEA
jgi:hypothetical protein